MPITLDGTTGITTAGLVVDGTEVSGLAPSEQIFTSPGTYDKPAELKKIKVTVVGGGAGGEGARGKSPPGGSAASSRGGGGGGASIEYIPAPSITGPVSVTVGGGGAGGLGAPAPAGGYNGGAAGGTSSFGAFCSATGGVGGPSRAGGVGSGGDINLDGGGGGGFGGPGGGSLLAQQASVDSPGTPGVAGFVYGGGGSGSLGGVISPSTVFDGGNGAAGIVIIEEFY